MTEPTFRPLRTDDGASLWEMTRDAKVLDLNSSYAYLLWCHDFADTSVIAELDGEPAGFVTGYLRPQDPTVLMVWQVAVDPIARGHGLASRMIDELVTRTGASTVETTITDDNPASQRLFGSLADRHGADHEITALFTPSMYPDGHDTEYLHRISPLMPTVPDTARELDTTEELTDDRADALEPALV